MSWLGFCEGNVCGDYWCPPSPALVLVFFINNLCIWFIIFHIALAMEYIFLKQSGNRNVIVIICCIALYIYKYMYGLYLVLIYLFRFVIWIGFRGLLFDVVTLTQPLVNARRQMALKTESPWTPTLYHQ